MVPRHGSLALCFFYSFAMVCALLFLTVRNARAIAISNVYYPAADRSVTSGLNNCGVQMGIDAFRNERKEFWPDIHRYFSKRKSSPPPQQGPVAKQSCVDSRQARDRS